MKEWTRWPLIVAPALLLGLAAPSPCAAAEGPASARTTTTASAATRTQPAARTTSLLPETIKPLTPLRNQPADDSLPSAVSPEIERFIKQSGRDLSQPLAPSPGIRQATGRRGEPAAGPAASSAESRGPRVIPIIRVAPKPSTRSPASVRGETTPPSPLARTPKLKAAPFETSDLRFPINLATALRLADARPIIVAAAQAKVWVAEAELTQANVLWVPDLNVGADYVRHDGGGPDFNKGIMTAPSTNFFYGGAGLQAMIGLTDAYFAPLAARQVLNAAQLGVQSAKNDALLQTADAYFLVHKYRGIFVGALYTVERGHEVVDRIASLGRDLVPLFEVDRARNMVADLEQQAVSARENWRVQSAKLTKVLRLDPRAVVEPLEHDHTQITLIDPGRALDDLMPIALTNRPELGSHRALIEAAQINIRREKARPLLPVVLLNGYQTPGGMLLQAGIFGLGPNSSLNQWTGRDDVSIQLIWQLQNIGLGNLARVKAQRGVQSQAIIDFRKTQDTVVEDVNQAHARVQSAAARVGQADRALRTGIITFNGALEGLEQTSRFGDVLVLVTRPQEAIYALQLLQKAFDEYFTTVAEYNRAQFELFHALGYPAIDVARLRPPGDLLPINTDRPNYLPPVGNGPPPATR